MTATPQTVSRGSGIPPSRSRGNSSASSSSLTSSSSFDPHDPRPVSPTQDERRPSALGIRDITKLYRADKKGKARERERGEREAAGPIGLQHEPGSSRTDLGTSLPGSAGDLFAVDVNVRGWKIVGGSKWTGEAKMGAYVVYDIEIMKRSGGEIEILRRYTDFVRLRNALKTRFPHLRGAIPSLPGKNHMAKFAEKLLEDRKPRLQRFLRTVMLHPEMGKGGLGSVIGEWVLSGTTTTAMSRPDR